MKYTITQRIVCKDENYVDYIRYFLDGENEEEVITLFKEKAHLIVSGGGEG